MTQKLKPYIRLVDIRNTNDERYDLLGVSVEKRFIKSIHTERTTAKPTAQTVSR